MSTNLKTTISSGLRFRLHLACVVLIAWAGWGLSPANATTESETALINSPLPHERLAAGRESVKVHWVRLQGYVEGKIGHAAMLDQLKAQVQRCVRAPLSGQSRPPRAWPDYVESIQRDTYEAANRTITYKTTLMYAVNPSDCSLMEIRGAMAQLASAKGFCEIDFIHKTAHGACDARAHGDAQAAAQTAAHATLPGSRAAAANAQARAALAAMEQAMKQFGPVKTGEHKTIAGLECDVQTNPLFGTTCISRGGAFAGWKAGSRADGARMELELTNVAGVNARAVKAQLDATVNAAVFSPYLADGFQVTNIARGK